MLKEAATRLLSTVRASDGVGRLGGDEFVAVLPLIEDAGEAVSAARRIEEALSVPLELGSLHLEKIGCSIGIACFPDHSSNVSELLQKADEAMYMAKRAGDVVYLAQPGISSTSFGARQEVRRD